MEETQPSAKRWARISMAGDAFIFAGTLWLILNVVPAAVLLVLGADEPSNTGGVLGASVWFLATIAPLFAGAIAAWVLHGRRVSGLAFGGMIAGVAAGFFGGFALLAALANVVRLVLENTGLRPESGPPWVLIGIIVAILAAALIWPLADAIRDLRPSRRAHTRIDILRLTSLSIIVVLAGIVAPWLGFTYESEIAEAGVFFGPIALAGALAVIGADVATGFSQRRHSLAAAAK